MFLAAVATLVALVVAWRDMRVVLYDDAAITLRYAWRIAQGLGFTYNNGDRTDGASAPLYTLLLALLSTFGAGLQGAAKIFCILSYAATVGLVSYLAYRLSGFFGGVLAPIVLIANPDYRLNALAGMESAFAGALGLAAIVALARRRDSLCGVLLGLAMCNRLDAAFVVIPVAIGVILVDRRIPFRMIAWTAAFFLPWVIFAQIYFGALIPNSAREKYKVESRGVSLDHAWMLQALRASGYTWVAVCAVLALPLFLLLRRNRSREAIAMFALVAWPAIHITAYGFVNLGGEYPWYKVVMYPPIACAGACAVGLVWTHIASSRALLAASMATLGIAGVIAVGQPSLSGIQKAAQTVMHGHVEDSYEVFEGTRRATGIYLAGVTSPGQVLETCFGWPAFLDETATIKETCPLSTRKPVRPPTWGADASFPADVKPVPPPGAVIVKVYVASKGGDSWVYRYLHP